MKIEKFFEAVRLGKIKDVRHFIQVDGVDVNVVFGVIHNQFDDPEEYSALMIACISRKYEMAEFLLQSKALVDLQNTYGFTALMYACANGYHEMVLLLIEYGASLDIKNRYGSTALMMSVKQHYFEIAQSLIESNADLNLQDNMGHTALMLACLFYDYARLTDRPKTIALLVDSNANLDIQDNEECTALMYLCRAISSPPNFLMAKYLIRHGANVSLKSKTDVDALTIAIGTSDPHLQWKDFHECTQLCKLIILSDPFVLKKSVFYQMRASICNKFEVEKMLKHYSGNVTRLFFDQFEDSNHTFINSLKPLVATVSLDRTLKLL